MAERIAMIYECSAGLCLGSLVRDFGAAGLSLLRPRDGMVWLLDGEGSSVVVSLDVFVERLAFVGEQGLQWWFADDSDVYCRIRRLGAVCCIELGMEGCDASERAGIGRAVLGRFLREWPRSVGFVFDAEGNSENCQWDSFFLTEHVLDWGVLGLLFPDAVGMRRADCLRFHNLPAGVLCRTQEELVIFSASPEWLGPLGPLGP